MSPAPAAVGRALGLTFCVLCLAAPATAPRAAAEEAGASDKSQSTARQPTSPFVAGFERLGRTAELKPVESGRLLLGELGCVTCHPAAKTAHMAAPRLGPRLEGVANRLQADWITRFLANPARTQPGTTMPNVLHGIPVGRKSEVIQALVAFLSTQREEFAELKSTASRPVADSFYDKGNTERGIGLFHQVGCVACHAPDPRYKARPEPPSELAKLLAQLDPEELKELGLDSASRSFPSVPHGNLASKYTRQGLAHFLIAPESMRPMGRMPSMKLAPAEAADLVAYLHPKKSTASLPAVSNQALVARGRQFFTEFKCHACHSATGASRPAAAESRPVHDLNIQRTSSCIATPPATQPRYQVDSAQAHAIRTAVTHMRELVANEASVAPSPELAVTRQLVRLNCMACHERNGRGGVGPKRRKYFESAVEVDLGDEGRLPPSLTGVGRKLQPAWLKKVLEGSGDVRPHLNARMPTFSVHDVVDLPRLLAQDDSASETGADKVFGKLDSLATSGLTLADRGCVQCHPIRGERLPGVVGVDLAGATSRLRPEWLRQFLLDPASQKSRTRMPTFFPKGKSNSPDILDGNVDRQLASLWAYLADIGKQPLPAKLVANKVDNFELVPKERPLVLRTFMQRAGRHAIAVGFPAEVHYAFNARTGHLVEAWRGRFLDAHATWFNRFIPPAAPLGKDLVTLPAGLSVARLTLPDSPWPDSLNPQTGYRFGGYRLDKSRVPTLRYSVGTLAVEDRIEPIGVTANGKRLAPALVRKLTIRTDETTKSGRPTAWVRALTGQQIRKHPDGTCRNEKGLKVSVQAAGSSNGTIVKQGTRSEWRIPVVITRQTTVELMYQW